MIRDRATPEMLHTEEISLVKIAWSIVSKAAETLNGTNTKLVDNISAFSAFSSRPIQRRKDYFN